MMMEVSKVVYSQSKQTSPKEVTVRKGDVRIISDVGNSRVEVAVSGITLSVR